MSAGNERVSIKSQRAVESIASLKMRAAPVFPRPMSNAMIPEHLGHSIGWRAVPLWPFTAKTTIEQKVFLSIDSL